MFSIITVSHGEFAKGMKDSMLMIAGDQENTYFSCFERTMAVKDFEDEINRIYESIPKDRQVLFLCDIIAGTPYHVAAKYKLLNKDRVEVIGGASLQLLISAITLKESAVSLEQLTRELLEETQSRLLEIKQEMDDE